MRIGTSPVAPDAMVSSGTAGSTVPSTTGRNGSPSVPAAAIICCWAASNASAGSCDELGHGRDTGGRHEPFGDRGRVRRLGRERGRSALQDRPGGTARRHRAYRAACRRSSRRPTRRRSSRRRGCRRTPRCCRAPTRARRSGRGCRALPDPANSGPAEVVEVSEPEGAEPVVDRDDDDVAGGREPGAVVPGSRARSEDERATVDPHHHRPAARRRSPASRRSADRQSSLGVELRLTRGALPAPTVAAGRRDRIGRRRACRTRARPAAAGGSGSAPAVDAA